MKMTRKIYILACLMVVGLISVVSGQQVGNPLMAVKDTQLNEGINVSPHRVDLSGTSPDVFNYPQFKKEPLNSRRMTFEDASWQEIMQRVDDSQLPWSLRDFLNTT
jgi:hypothetical protein